MCGVAICTYLQDNLSDKMESLISIIRGFRYRIMKSRVTRQVLNKVTIIGTAQNIEPPATILLQFGAHKGSVVLDDHSELFGRIIAWGEDAKVRIGKYAKIGFNCTINCVDGIEIDDYAAVADGVTVVDHNYHPTNPSDRKYMRTTPHGAIERSPLFSQHSPIKIGKNVMLGHNVRVCKGVTIGDNSIIGANSIVTKSIPSNCIAVGNPARVVKENIDQTTSPIFPLNR